MRYLYAIERITDGRFLPRPPSGQKGGTWVEPADPAKELPRFFARERDAKGFLTTWLKGPLLVKHYQTFEGDEDYTHEHRPDLAKQARVATEWRVVKIEWRICS